MLLEGRSEVYQFVGVAVDRLKEEGVMGVPMSSMSTLGLSSCEESP